MTRVRSTTTIWASSTSIRRCSSSRSSGAVNASISPCSVTTNPSSSLSIVGCVMNVRETLRGRPVPLPAGPHRGLAGQGVVPYDGRRLAPGGEAPQLDQKTNDSTRPTAPTIIRIAPTVTRSIPDTVAVTAHARIAPTAISTRLTEIPMVAFLSSGEALRSPDTPMRVGAELWPPKARRGPEAHGFTDSTSGPDSGRPGGG